MKSFKPYTFISRRKMDL